VDAYPLDVDDEGDPVAMAINRTTTFGRRRKVLITSTPTVKDVSRVEKEWERSDKRRFYVPCPHCGHRQWLRWRGYNDDPNDPRAKDYRLVWLDEAKTKAGYKCGGEDCGALIEEHHKTAMLLAGEWVPTVLTNGRVKGYHLSSLYSPLGWKAWVDVLREFEECSGDPAQLKVFVNTVLAETWEDQTTMRLDAEGLASRAQLYPLCTVPAGGLVLTAGIDMQRREGGYAQIIVRAWGEGEESWLVDRKLIYGSPATPDFWQQVLDAINTQYPNTHGCMMPIYSAAIDSGDGETTHDVYAFARAHRRRHILATKGMSQPGRAALGKPSKQDVNIRGQTIKNGVMLWPIGSDTIKGLVHGRMRLEADRGPSVMHWPVGLPDDYWQQLTAERQIVKLVNGFPKRVWVKKDSAKNEDLDCEVMAYAALEYVKTRHNRQTRWRQFADRLPRSGQHQAESAMTPPDPEVPTAPVAVVAAAASVTSAGRVSLSGWKRG
jgi:phage terminase large subunit GpA-like protein